MNNNFKLKAFLVYFFSAALMFMPNMAMALSASQILTDPTVEWIMKLGLGVMLLLGVVELIQKFKQGDGMVGTIVYCITLGYLLTQWSQVVEAVVGG
jgi:zinc transporter ZupT